MSNLTFQEQGHVYRIDGLEVPSVTQVLKEAGLSNFDHVNPEVLERAANFGTAVHKAIQFSVKDTLCHETLDQGLLPYLDQWKAFCADYGYVPGFMEHQVFNKVLGIAGTIDHIGLISSDTTIVDLKTGALKCADLIQVCAYGYLYPVKRTILLYLKEDRYFTIEPNRQQRKGNEQIFLSALSLYNYRKREGLL